jgi:phosphopantothenoylcysteine decarboxylase/phosphopantothenate--cysteine ligase
VRVVLGVGGGIAAYKAASLLRSLRRQATKSPSSPRMPPRSSWALHVGGPLGPPGQQQRVRRRRQGQPCPPRTRGRPHRRRPGDGGPPRPRRRRPRRRPAHRDAPDGLRAGVHGAAMHTEMWTHAATAANVALLRSRGVHVLEPATGRLTVRTPDRSGCRSPPTSSPRPCPSTRAAPGPRPGRSPDAPSPSPPAGRASRSTRRFLATGPRQAGHGPRGGRPAAGASVNLITAAVEVSRPAGVRLRRREATGTRKRCSRRGRRPMCSLWPRPSPTSAAEMMESEDQENRTTAPTPCHAVRNPAHPPGGRPAPGGRGRPP